MGSVPDKLTLLSNAQDSSELAALYTNPHLACLSWAGMCAGLGPLPCGVLWEKLVGTATLGFE